MPHRRSGRGSRVAAARHVVGGHGLRPVLKGSPAGAGAEPSVRAAADAAALAAAADHPSSPRPPPRCRLRPLPRWRPAGESACGEREESSPLSPLRGRGTRGWRRPRPWRPRPRARRARSEPAALGGGTGALGGGTAAGWRGLSAGDHRSRSGGGCRWLRRRWRLGDARLLRGLGGSAGGSGARRSRCRPRAASTPVSVASPVATIVGWRHVAHSPQRRGRIASEVAGREVAIIRAPWPSPSRTRGRTPGTCPLIVASSGGGRIVDVREQGCDRVLALVGHLAGEHLVEDAAQRVDVGAGVDASCR